MPDTSDPPLLRTAFAAGVGGFAGAVLGVVVATAMMNGGDDNNGSAMNEAAPEAQVAVIDHE